MSELQKALVGALAELDDPTKNRTGQHGSSYLDLAGLLSAVRKVLAKHDLAVTQDVVVDEGTLVVTTEILHSGGEARVYGPARVRAAGDMQQLGGFITYLRRYQLSSALGIAGAEDDDGHSIKGQRVAPVDVGSATGPLARHKTKELATEPQRKKLAVLAKKAGHAGPKEFLASEQAASYLNGEPSSPLLKGHASQLIDALTELLAETTEPELDEMHQAQLDSAGEDR